MEKVMIFGTGLIGGFIANQLSKKYDVVACDGDIDNLNKLDRKITVIDKFVRGRNEMMGMISHHNPDIIVNALPGHIGYSLLEAAVSVGKNIMDISFMEEDPLELNEKAIENNVTAAIDFGFAPGFSHMFVGRANKLLDKHDESVIYVGGLQLNSEEYKAVFSPADIIQEYTRPARYLKGGEIKTEIPFEKDYDTVLNDNVYSGFINDGLRTLVHTLDVQTLIEITLRSPKHFAFIQELKNNGFFKPEHFEYTSQVLADKWKMTEADRDYSLMYVESKGNGKIVTHYMYDEYDEETNTHSMARATGLPVLAMVDAILERRYIEKGVIPPEYIAKNDEIYNFVVKYLQDHGVIIEESQ